MALPSGTITLLFTDIEGSTQLWEHSPDAMNLALARHDVLLKQAIEDQGGYVFKTVGDAFCAAFSDPADALEAILTAQRSLAAEPWPAEIGAIRVRAALHTGVAEERDGDYFGPPVNRVARLLSAGHGGQTLITMATQSLVQDHLPPQATLVDLGSHRLKDLFRPEQIFQVNAPDLPAEFAPLKTLDTQLTNLPAQSTLFIGREREVTDVKDLLLRDDVRLVTLTGPGGTGKTRLSLHVAGELLDQFRDGVYFVPLAETTDHNLVVSKIALALDVREGSTQPLINSLLDYLRDQSMLLVLDNFEQLVGVSSIGADLLAGAPRLKLLISSQIVLRIRGEHEYPVLPLTVPDVSDHFDLEELQHNDCVKLFMQLTQSVNPKFVLTPENAPSIAEICQRLDGLPLALELAAARTQLLTPQAMVARLTDRMALLTGGARDLPTRQQTLRGALDWSHSLLEDNEKLLFARLGIFVGGFSLEAAEAICNTDGAVDVLGGIETLLSNSLIRQEEGEYDLVRFRMLETIREYAVEELMKLPEMAAIKRAHGLYYVTKVAVEISFKLFTSEAVMWLHWLENEHDNIRAALGWAQTASEADDLMAPLLFTLSWFWYRRGYLLEGRAWADAFLETEGAAEGSLRRAAILIGGQLITLWQGEAKTSLTRGLEALAVLQRLEDDQFMPYGLLSVGIVHVNMGNDAQAVPMLEQASQLFKAAKNDPFYAISLVHLGNASLGFGKPEEAREWLDRAYPVALEAGDEWIISFALNNMGEVARVMGDYSKAREYYEQSEALLREVGDPGDLARLVHTLGYVAQHEGDLVKARMQFTESLAMFRKFGNKRGLAECLMGLASLEAAQGELGEQPDSSVRRRRSLSENGLAWWPADRGEVEHTRTTIESALDETELPPRGSRAGG